MWKSRKQLLMTILALLLLAGCGAKEPPNAARYQQPDALFARVLSNVEQSDDLQVVLEIDHSRLGAEAGSAMPPARVLIFSNPHLEAQLIKQNPLTAIDLPLRILAFESKHGGPARVIYNNYDYLESRYSLGSPAELRAMYEDSIAQALGGMPAEQIAAFDNNTMQSDGIITIDSPFDFATTMERVQAGIDSQDDTVRFDSVDFQQVARRIGIEIAPASLLLFGGPAPGAKAMSSAPTLGLDAFCQKFLVWQGADGKVQLSFNDLLAMAERHGSGKSIPLRVINYRLTSVFEDVLKP